MGDESHVQDERGGPTASDTATMPSVVAIRNGTREKEKMASRPS